MSDQPYYDPSDSVDIPDDAEPWENRPDAVADWRFEVANGDTRRGFDDWFAHQQEMAADDNPSLICTKCGTIGNNEDLAFLGEPCPRSQYEDDDCDGVMVLYVTARDSEGALGRVARFEIGGVEGELIIHHSEGWIGVNLAQFGHRVAVFSMDHDVAVRFANAILSEVEIAQTGGY